MTSSIRDVTEELVSSPSVWLVHLVANAAEYDVDDPQVDDKKSLTTGWDISKPNDGS